MYKKLENVALLKRKCYLCNFVCVIVISIGQQKESINIVTLVTYVA